MTNDSAEGDIGSSWSKWVDAALGHPAQQATQQTSLHCQVIKHIAVIIDSGGSKAIHSSPILVTEKESRSDTMPIGKDLHHMLHSPCLQVGNDCWGRYVDGDAKKDVFMSDGVEAADSEEV